ncbi:MAG TPA: phosphodiester glycosidase family protein [Chitinophagaceae bacterium]|nr:phosphodiester glycosidase family protein [Chitinophagaceae bacterium]
MPRILFSTLLIFSQSISYCQLTWQNVDSLYQPLPSSVHVYFTNDQPDTGAFRAFYLIADLKDKQLNFTTDTTYKRRLTPSQYYQKNDKPLVVVNCTFFSFETNQNLNLVIKEGRIVSHSIYLAPLRGKDTLLYAKNLASAIGISKKRIADIGWIYTDSNMKRPVIFEKEPILIKDSSRYISKFLFVPEFHHYPAFEKRRGIFIKKWETAVGGGPVLLQNGKIRITNNEERKFTGKAINDKHPRTAMGYTKDNKLIILVVEGRNQNAHGATLTQEAQIFKDLGCIEALNLDGGGSSCLLINGKETIKVSDKTQRPVPAVFLIKGK